MKNSLWNIMGIVMTVVLCAPTYAFAMANIPEAIGGYGIIIIMTCIVIWFAIRELRCWYWKVNLQVELETETIKHQDTIIKLLQEIRDNSSGSTITKSTTPSANQVTVCSKCNKVYDGNLSGQYCTECGSMLS